MPKKEISFAEAAPLHGLTRNQLRDACHRYYDKAPKPVRQDRITREKYFDPDQLSKFIDWYLGQDADDAGNEDDKRTVMRSYLEVQQAELARAKETTERNLKRVQNKTAELAKANADLEKSRARIEAAEQRIALYKKQQKKLK